MPYYPPKQEEAQRSDPPRRPSTVRWILLCYSALIILYGTIRLYSYYHDLNASRHTTQAFRDVLEQEDVIQETEIYAEDENASEEEADLFVVPVDSLEEQSDATPDTLSAVPYPNGYELVPSIRALRKQSEYIIGWLTMDDLDEPVAYKDNDFFLIHDAAGKRNVNGSIFMDEHTSLLTRPYTILLYGHNMKTGAMFGNLRKYETFSYCYQHRMIKFDTLYEEGQYEIFAVAKISITPGKSRYVDIRGLQSTDRMTRSNALKALLVRNTYDMTTDVKVEDQLLILITCVGEKDERLVVAAKRV